MVDLASIARILASLIDIPVMFYHSQPIISTELTALGQSSVRLGLIGVSLGETQKPCGPDSGPHEANASAYCRQPRLVTTPPAA